MSNKLFKLDGQSSTSLVIFGENLNATEFAREAVHAQVDTTLFHEEEISDRLEIVNYRDRADAFVGINRKLIAHVELIYITDFRLVEFKQILSLVKPFTKIVVEDSDDFEITDLDLYSTIHYKNLEVVFRKSSENHPSEETAA